MATVAQQIRSLSEQLREHDYRYYVLAEPSINDCDYDALLEQLKGLEAEHPDLIAPDSPTQRVSGQPITGFESVRHAVAMLSIDNTYNETELRDFDDRVRRGLDDATVRYVVDPKVDGVAASLRYEQGKLVGVATRGNGEVGDDITQNARTIKAIPLSLRGTNYPKVLEVRGEVYWPLSTFSTFNAEREAAGEPLLANPRNATTGSLKQHDSRSLAGRGLSFVVHGVGEIQGPTPDTYMELMSAARAWGLPVSAHLCPAESIDTVVTMLNEWDTKRHELDYLLDGLVIKVDSLAQRQRLGATSKYPRWCIAYKFAAEQAETVVRDITLQVGKLGTITPVAEFEPVQLALTEVRRASLHNFDQVERLDIRVGDRVLIEKAGEIIPQVRAVLLDHRRKGARRMQRPAACPVCKGDVKQDENGVFLRCTNPTCPAKVRERLIFFCGRNQMDITGAGPALIDQLLSANLVGDYADFYALASRRDELLALDRLGEKSVDNLLAGIDASRKRSLDRLLVALSIPHIGATTATLIADELGTLSAVAAAAEERLLEIDGVGPELAASLLGYFESKVGQQTLRDLEAAGVNMTQPRRSQSAGPLSGKTVVATGTLTHFSRKGIEQFIRTLGGKSASSVSARTDFLIHGDKAGSKLKKARELGVETLDEQAFVDRFGIPEDA
jgi:DNA ligase (NAD+)